MNLPHHLANHLAMLLLVECRLTGRADSDDRIATLGDMKLHEVLQGLPIDEHLGTVMWR